ncbi:glyoxalase-like domain protein [Arthrobacter sp. ERGS1:01]|uniref:VOC family protein n=1 Tax=Arthrobacter sp. ERGS1:01 TaxID=1704044 RepID=UPI0006B5A5E2|nr:VOC family protein [Arthrobacter sp. ERGS1:01]ALE07202.1 glyoxalase-like domain protein [Arthrobacter sp. ERGS1:01]
MAYSLQIVVDSPHPHALADWWAETMGWEVEPSDEAFIRIMVEQGHATEDQTTHHNGKLVWAVGQAITAGQTAGTGQPRILFQLGTDAKQGKNRVHWDVRLDGEDKAAVRARLEERGATFLWEASQGPYSWITMADPEGNEFCIG